MYTWYSLLTDRSPHGPEEVLAKSWLDLPPATGFSMFDFSQTKFHENQFRIKRVAVDFVVKPASVSTHCIDLPADMDAVSTFLYLWCWLSQMAYEAHIKRGTRNESGLRRWDSQPDKESDADDVASCGCGDLFQHTHTHTHAHLHTHTHTHTDTVIKLCIWDHSEAIQQSPASLSADRVHAFWHVSRAYSYWVVSATAQNPMQGLIQEKWQKFSFSHNVLFFFFLLKADFMLVSRSHEKTFWGPGSKKKDR